MNVDNPFELNNWLNTQDQIEHHGESDTGDDLQAGRLNDASFNDATIVSTQASNNAAFVGRNTDMNNAGIGLYGESDSEHNGVGTAGFCRAGVGTFGITAGGVGVAGRAMQASAVDDPNNPKNLPFEKQVGAVGVFGQSVIGTGVRGHGGNLSLKVQLNNESGTTIQQRRVIGGVFSTGTLEESAWGISKTGEFEFSSAKSQPMAQLQLVPSFQGGSPKLPSDGRPGDLFMVVGSRFEVHLFVCIGLAQDKPTDPVHPLWKQLAWSDRPAQVGGDTILPI